jgi:hypothetical protein
LLILVLLGVAVAVQQAWVLMCLRLHQQMAGTAEVLFCIMERIMAAEVAGLLVLLVHTEVQPKVGAAELHHRRVAATGLLVQRRHRHNLVLRIQVAVEAVARMPQRDTLEQQVVLV